LFQKLFLFSAAATTRMFAAGTIFFCIFRLATILANSVVVFAGAFIAQVIATLGAFFSFFHGFFPFYLLNYIKIIADF